ncbi:ankyrin repeat and death domain-containing protein 1A-like isoform X1 [Branchiostoma floridae]|uniref:Ankyrin repeat and death domain-containing protein 1A-like isoform X1 n=1 Tax=Branchiostoma floridae TaxID=7739 RepID=A0A9J7KJA5_BRAFL|nr:ankyrin repeat and death domain-containing protein 1A-like isoform X1 [Branchiostoma floridae]
MASVEDKAGMEPGTQQLNAKEVPTTCLGTQGCFFRRSRRQRNTSLSMELIEAAEEGEVTRIQRLVKRGADVNVGDPDRQGNSALHQAVLKGHADVVQLLLNAGSQINIKNQDGDTPLHCAASSNMQGILKLLVNYSGCSINAKNYHGDTALHCSARCGHTDVARHLISLPGIQVNMKNNLGYTALHISAAACRCDLVNMFLEDDGCQLDSRNKHGNTPLHEAAMNGCVDVVRQLVNANCDVKAENKDGNTPLHSAAWGGHCEVARLLITGGTNINTRNSNGDTPLHVAAQMGHSEVAHTLIHAGCHLNILNYDNMTARDICQDHKDDNHKEIVAEIDSITRIKNDTATRSLADIVLIEIKGVLSDESLWKLSKCIGSEWDTMMVYLGFHQMDIVRVRLEFFCDMNLQIYSLLKEWRNRTPPAQEKLGILADALREVGRKDLAENLLIGIVSEPPGEETQI